MKPAHRDDLPPELLEMLEKKFPGMKIVCAGDIPEGQMPEGLVAKIEAIKMAHAQSVVDGTCIDCGKKMPGYPADDEDFPEGWQKADGWLCFTDISSGEPSGWQCPECDAKERDDGV